MLCVGSIESSRPGIPHRQPRPKSITVRWRQLDPAQRSITQALMRLFCSGDGDALGQLVAEDAVLDLEKQDLPSQFPVGGINQHQGARGEQRFHGSAIRKVVVR